MTILSCARQPVWGPAPQNGYPWTIYRISLKYSTIQVTPRMRRRLARYKRPGMSYEDVLEVLLAAIPPEEFEARHERARRAAHAELTLMGRRDPAAASEEARLAESYRLAGLTPGERMEEAYRLFEVVRGRE